VGIRIFASSVPSYLAEVTSCKLLCWKKRKIEKEKRNCEWAMEAGIKRK
jgi:hypothetical protein